MNTTQPIEITPIDLLDLAHENSDYGDCCAMCGKRNAKFALAVRTEQGEFPIGKTCAAKLRKQGYLILTNWQT